MFFLFLLPDLGQRQRPSVTLSMSMSVLACLPDPQRPDSACGL